MNNLIVEGLVEIPTGSTYKYEIKDGKVYLDRPLSTKYPMNYGYVVDTLAQDGDPLDLFILSSKPIPSNTYVKVEIIAGFNGVDTRVDDPKLIGVLCGEYEPNILYNNDTESMEELLNNIEIFLNIYKPNHYLVESKMTQNEIQMILTNSQFIYRMLNKEKK